MKNALFELDPDPSATIMSSSGMMTEVLSLSMNVPSPSCPSSFRPQDETVPSKNKKYDDSLPATRDVILLEKALIS